MQTECHVLPGSDPFTGIDGARLERRHDLTARKTHHNGTYTPQHFAPEPRHSIAQPLECFERGHLFPEPAAHLCSSAEQKEWLDIELSAELIPQFLTAAETDPCEQLIGGKSERNAAIESESQRLLFKVAVIRVIHVRNALRYRIESFECAHKCVGREYLNLDTTLGHFLDRLSQPTRGGKQARHGVRSRSPSSTVGLPVRLRALGN